MRGVAPWGMRSRRVAGSCIGVSLGVTSTSTSGWPTAMRLTMPPGRSRIACRAGGEPIGDDVEGRPQVDAFDDEVRRPAGDGGPGHDPDVLDGDRLGTRQAKLIEQVVDGVGGDRAGDADTHAAALDGSGPGPHPQAGQIGAQSIDVALSTGAGGLDRSQVGLQLVTSARSTPLRSLRFAMSTVRSAALSCSRPPAAFCARSCMTRRTPSTKATSVTATKCPGLPHGVAPAPLPPGSWPPGGVDATGPP